MKKIVSLLLALVLVFACASFVAAEDVTGTWYLIEMTSEGISLDPSMFGIEMTLELFASGTATMSAMGESASGTWVMEGNTVVVTLDDTVLRLDYTLDGSLAGESDGVGLKFQRTGSASYEPSAEVNAHDISEFNGTWIPVKIGAMGIYMDPDMLSSFGLDQSYLDALVFTIKDGSMSIPDEDELISLTFSDGFLSVTLPGNEGTLTVKLLEDGLISIASPTLGFTFICERASESR